MAVNLKQHRLQRGLTLEQMAKDAGLTKSYVSKVERGLSTPSIGSAMGIAAALGISVERLFGQADGPDEPMTIIRAGDGASKDPDAYLTLVAGANPKGIMRAFVVRPGNKGTRGRAASHHDGEEILFVLKGRIELRVGKSIQTLGVGDCVHFNSSMPHQLSSVGATPASALVVVAASQAGASRGR